MSFSFVYHPTKILKPVNEFHSKVLRIEVSISAIFLNEFLNVNYKLDEAYAIVAPTPAFLYISYTL
jgi:hypothetical protein